MAVLKVPNRNPPPALSRTLAARVSVTVKTMHG